MRSSLLGRLQLWYAFILLVVVVGFAGLLYYRVRSARLREIDAGLEADVLYLDAVLRRFPPFELGGPQGKKSFPPPWEEKKGPKPPPPRPEPPNRERLYADLTVPWRSGPPQDGRDRSAYFAVWRADGTLLKAYELPEATVPPEVPSPEPPRTPRLGGRSDYREAVMGGPAGARILVGRHIGRERNELAAFAWQLAAAGTLALTVGLAGGWWVSGRLFRPIAEIAATASAISAANLGERIDAGRVDQELAELASVLNSTFARLEASFERQAQFTADASHELRTPLAIIRSHAELALNRPRSADEYRDTIESCLRASVRMSALVEGLLTLARADAGRLELRRVSVDLQPLLEETLALLEPLAREKQLALTTTLARTVVNGDPIRLAQVLTNLLTNAIQYNQPGGFVHIDLIQEATACVLRVTDTGCGIPPEDALHLFERFFRVDKARSRASGGSGLGLAICHSIVTAHGGTIGFESTPEQGSTFWVRLPIASTS